MPDIFNIKHLSVNIYVNMSPLVSRQNVLCTCTYGCADVYRYMYIYIYTYKT